MGCFETLNRGRETHLSRKKYEVERYGTFTAASDALATRDKKKGFKKRKLKINDEVQEAIDAL